MNYQEAIRRLESLIDYERTPAAAQAARVWNLDRIAYMLQAVGNPHLGTKFLHIAGTRGKGSTAAVTASILTSAGYRTGLYTSPHLQCFRERIRIDGEMISEAELASLVEETQPIVEEMSRWEIGAPSFFDVYTFLALMHFARKKVDFAILEPGLGGRLDATNVVTPIACAITRIGVDHTEELGNTLAQIAGEKAGIIKPGVPVVTSEQPDEAMEVLEGICRERECRLVPAPTVEVTHADEFGQKLRVNELDLECPLLGAHQAENVGVAIGLIRQMGHPIPDCAIAQGVKSVRWPGRFQIVRRNPHVILDGGVDETGAKALAATMLSLFPGRRVIVVFGMVRGHDTEAVARVLAPLADKVYVTAAHSPRAVDPSVIQKYVSGDIVVPVAEAVVKAINEAGEEDIVLITGSLYIVGEAMTSLGISA
ncbi:MAG TPA: folylpolyglutamate synthase/dihydrofolate synthase family protein [Armatimonadota bacterium]|nr:folylpolyglutamate synthase/dihydrofolate synthase family protein [Armatimonadota bacterium]